MSRPAPDPDDPTTYRSIVSDPRELRPRAANRTAALALLAGIVIIIMALALFT